MRDGAQHFRTGCPVDPYDDAYDREDLTSYGSIVDYMDVDTTDDATAGAREYGGHSVDYDEDALFARIICREMCADDPAPRLTVNDLLTPTCLTTDEDPGVPITRAWWRIACESNLGLRRRQMRLQKELARLASRLAPLRPEPVGSAGPPHDSFPDTIMDFHLLGEAQLDALARYYHQLTDDGQPCVWTHAYPAAMDLDVPFLEHVARKHGPKARLDIKRRKFGRFIGLRHCETPRFENDLRRQFHAARRAAGFKDAGDSDFLGRRGLGGV